MSQEKSARMGELRLDDFLRVVDVATAIRQRQEEAGQQLDIHEARDKLKEKLRETSRITGENLTDSQIESSVDSYFEGLYSFNEPERNLGTRFADMYVERRRLTRRYVLPPVAFGAAAITVLAVSDVIRSARLKAQEGEIENLVETTYQESRAKLSEIDLLLNSPFAAQLPQVERDQFISDMDGSQQKIRSTDPFFDQYCSDGTSEDDVTLTNFQDARNNLSRVEGLLREADSDLQEGKSIIKTQEDLTLVKRNLDTIIGEIRASNPHESLYKRAARIYSAGQGEIERRNLKGAIQNELELRGVKDDLSRFSDLTSKIEALYGSVIAIAVEQEALQRGEALYKEAKQYTESADVPRLSQSASQLSDLANVLDQEYILRIINRPGVKSGQDRYYTDKDGKRASGHYLIVEAVDTRGNVITMNIRNEEDGRTEKVTMWGERVPESIYERVKEDKLDNGLINDDIVGKKKRGYLNEEMIMSGVTKLGQITGW